MHASPRVHVSRRGSIDIEMPRGVGAEEMEAPGDNEMQARSAGAPHPSKPAATSKPTGPKRWESETRSADSERYDRAVAVVQRALLAGDNAPAPLRPGSAEDQAHDLAQQVLAALDGIGSRTVEDEQYVHAIRTAFVLISAGALPMGAMRVDDIVRRAQLPRQGYAPPPDAGEAEDDYLEAIRPVPAVEASQLLVSTCEEQQDAARKTLMQVPLLDHPTDGRGDAIVTPTSDDIETQGERLARMAHARMDAALEANERLMAPGAARRRREADGENATEVLPTISFIIDTETLTAAEATTQELADAEAAEQEAADAARRELQGVSYARTYEELAQSKNEARRALYEAIALKRRQARVSEAAVAVLGRGISEEEVCNEFNINDEELRTALAMLRQGIIPVAASPRSSGASAFTSPLSGNGGGGGAPTDGGSALTAEERAAVLSAALDVAVKQGNARTPSGAVLRPRKTSPQRTSPLALRTAIIAPPLPTPVWPSARDREIAEIKIELLRAAEKRVTPIPSPEAPPFTDGLAGLAAEHRGVRNIESKVLVLAGEITRAVRRGLDNKARHSPGQSPQIGSRGPSRSPSSARRSSSQSLQSPPHEVPLRDDASGYPGPAQAPRVHISRHGSVQIDALGAAEMERALRAQMERPIRPMKPAIVEATYSSPDAATRTQNCGSASPPRSGRRVQSVDLRNYAREGGAPVSPPGIAQQQTLDEKHPPPPPPQQQQWGALGLPLTESTPPRVRISRHGSVEIDSTGFHRALNDVMGTWSPKPYATPERAVGAVLPRDTPRSPVEVPHAQSPKTAPGARPAPVAANTERQSAPGRAAVLLAVASGDRRRQRTRAMLSTSPAYLLGYNRNYEHSGDAA